LNPTNVRLLKDRLQLGLVHAWRDKLDVEFRASGLPWREEQRARKCHRGGEPTDGFGRRRSECLLHRPSESEFETHVHRSRIGASECRSY